MILKLINDHDCNPCLHKVRVGFVLKLHQLLELVVEETFFAKLAQQVIYLAIDTIHAAKIAMICPLGYGEELFAQPNKTAESPSRSSNAQYVSTFIRARALISLSCNLYPKIFEKS